MKLYRIVIIVILLGLMGCAAHRIKESIIRYQGVANEIQIGDSKNKVLSILEPTQRRLRWAWRKMPEKYMKNGVLVEIYFFRTALHPDGLTTDDEFTPYIFNDGLLVAIGWTAIGGPKTQGQVIPQTNVNVHQKIVVY